MESMNGLSIARQVQDASNAAGRLVLPEGERAIVAGSAEEGRSVMTFTFSDGSELCVATVSVEGAYWTPSTQEGSDLGAVVMGELRKLMAGLSSAEAASTAGALLANTADRFELKKPS